MTNLVQNSEPLPFELEAMSRAHRYQGWIHDHVAPYLGKRILEVGSGAGAMSQGLPVGEKLMLSEGEPALFALLDRKMKELHASAPEVRCVPFPLNRELLDVARLERIDTVVSFNVMEHIDDDEVAFQGLFDLLRRAPAISPKRLVTVVPAHSWAYGGIDRSFGHFRRYDHRSLSAKWRRLAPDFDVTYRHFNLPGLVAWILMGRVLKRTSFGASSVENFERLLPWIRPVDDFLHGPLRLPVGQSLLLVATKA